MSKTNHGPCLVCGRPILYFGCRFCSPGCNFDFLKNPMPAGLEAATAAPAQADRSDPEPVVEPGPPVVPPEPEPEERPMSGFMGISSPPDEAPSRGRRAS